MKRRSAFMAIGVLGFALLLAGCGHTDRPEGVVERWLIALNQGSAGRPGIYAPELLSQGVLPNWGECEPGAIEVIEVGRGIEATALPKLGGTQYLVPYGIEYTNQREELCNTTRQPDVASRGVAVLVLQDYPDRARIRVVAALPESAVDRHLPLPSEGGRPVAKASAVPWMAALALGLLLCVGVAVLMHFMPRPAPLLSEPLDETEARGL
jgi:hypothetical protein